MSCNSTKKSHNCDKSTNFCLRDWGNPCPNHIISRVARFTTQCHFPWLLGYFLTFKYYQKYGKWPDWCEFHQISRQWDQNSKIRWTELNVIMFWVNVLYRLFKMDPHVELEQNTCHEWNYLINHSGTQICVRIVINRCDFWPENTFLGNLCLDSVSGSSIKTFG